jgi:hypothetical protein
LWRLAVRHALSLGLAANRLFCLQHSTVLAVPQDNGAPPHFRQFPGLKCIAKIFNLRHFSMMFDMSQGD